MKIRTAPTGVRVSSYACKRRGFIGWIRVSVIRLLNLLPPKIARAVFLAFSGRDGDTIAVFRGVATWEALEIMYTYPKRRREGKVNLTSVFWENFLDNARSIRNRLALVKEELREAIRKVSRQGEPVRFLSVGSGSARPVLETVASLNGQVSIEVTLIDRDEAAIRFSGQLAAELSVNHATKLTGNFFRLRRDAAEFHPHLVELVGLLDYLTEKQAVLLLKEILQVLEPRGYLVTSNITHNLEVPFVTKGINWPMIYRTPEELQELLIQAGFLAPQIRITQEPLGIHTLAIAQK